MNVSKNAERAQARDRIALFFRLCGKVTRPGCEEQDRANLQSFAMLLPQSTPIAMNNPVILDLQNHGFIGSANYLSTLLETFKRISSTPSDLQAFLTFMLQQELNHYVAQSNKQDGYAQGCQLFLESPQDPRINTFLKQQDQLAQQHELKTLIEFYNDPDPAHQAQLPSYTHQNASNEKVDNKFPPIIWELVQKKYPLLNGAPQPAKKQVQLSAENIGMKLDQLCEIMNSGKNVIELPGLPCDGKPNPFPVKVNNHYTKAVITDGAFKIHAYYKDAAGIEHLDDYEGWLKDFTAPMAEALASLSYYKVVEPSDQGEELRIVTQGFARVVPAKSAREEIPGEVKVVFEDNVGVGIKR